MSSFEAVADLLNEHPSLIPEILSYVIATPEDYARLRQVTPRWNASLLPRALTASRNLRNCSRAQQNIFVKEAVNFDFDSMAGKLKAIHKPFPLFDEFVELESMLFVRDIRDDCDPPIFISKDEGYSGVSKDTSDTFSKFCDALCDDTTSWKDFQTIGARAYQQGMFLSVEDFEQAKKKGAEIHTTLLCHPVILTVKLPSDRAEILENSSFGRKALLNARINLDFDIEDFKDHFKDYYNKRVVPFVEYLDDSMATGLKTISARFVGYNVRDNEDGNSVTCQIPIMIALGLGREEKWGSPRSCVPLMSLWNQSQEQTTSEGVAFCDGVITSELRNSLITQIDKFSNQQILDYHPHSKNIVRDIVHPALYSYVKGVSPLIRATKEVPPEIFAESFHELEEKSEDYWGREYEASAKYQWLPTYFDIGLDGSCTICDYINNIVPRSEHEELYKSLARLFSQALPLLESVYSYCRVVKEHHLRDPDNYNLDGDLTPIRESPISLRGRRLQVVTKIVDYELSPGQTYEGVWHVEGMSHEEIVATAIYFVERDPHIVGGDIVFKRAFHQDEGDYIVSWIGRDEPDRLVTVWGDGLMPLGKVETRSGRFLVFPNSHVHKVTKLENTERPNRDNAKRISTTKKRRIIVFFLINPEKRIVSTREIPVQQEHAGGSMKRKDALEHRLELMKERKYTKQNWNVREVELCEH